MLAGVIINVCVQRKLYRNRRRKDTLTGVSFLVWEINSERFVFEITGVY